MMFDEYENDPDESSDLRLNPIVFPLGQSEDLGPATIGEAELSLSSRSVVYEQPTLDSVLEYLEGQRFEQDKIFYDIYDADGTGYDQEGFVSKEFKFQLKKIDEVVNGLAALDPEVFERGSIGIYADVIEDKVATGGDIASGEFTIYSAVGRLGEGTPSIKHEEHFQDTYDAADFASGDYDSITLNTYDISSVRYNNLEEQALFLKYAAVPGITESIFDDPVVGYLNDIFNTMALDVYNTVITREYVPKLIKQETMSVSALLATSIGDELAPLESTVFETTTTFEEEI
jgi:hypothetical protein